MLSDLVRIRDYRDTVINDSSDLLEAINLLEKNRDEICELAYAAISEKFVYRYKNHTVIFQEIGHNVVCHMSDQLVFKFTYNKDIEFFDINETLVLYLLK